MSKVIGLFRSSARELRTTRCLTLTAMLIACNVALTLLGVGIKLTPELRVSFGYLFNASIGMLFGPVVGMLAGTATDILNYFAGNSSMGGYFPGFTVTAILGGVFYGLWLYRPDGRVQNDSIHQRIFRVVGAKFCITLFCNIMLNTFWLTVLSGKALGLLLPARALTNVLLFIPECILLYFVLELVLRLQRSLGLSARS